MSSTGFTGQQQQQNLKQELQNELTAASQNLWELHAQILQLKEFTKPGGELEASIIQFIIIDVLSSRSSSVGHVDNDLEKSHDTPQIKRGKRFTIKEYLIDYTANSNLHGLKSSSVGHVDNDLEKSHDTPQIKRGKRFTIKEYLIDYTANSNLHGLKYIGEKERTPAEKLFWLFMFICCVVLCAGLIRKVWIKWNESPVIVSFAENSTPVWQIPYPAVTVCFETKSLQTRFNFTKYYHLYKDNETYMELTEEERNMFEDITLVCDDHLAPARGRKFSDGYATVENLKQVSPNISEFFFGCKWKDTPKDNCANLFSPILTEDGVCYTFNTLHKEYQYLESTIINSTSDNVQRWSLEEGYPPSAPLETYPHRGSGYGAKAGLTFLLQTKAIDLDYLCKGPVQGFKILLHNPAELPRLSQQYFRSPLSQEVVVAVRPKMMTTSDGLKPYLPSVQVLTLLNEHITDKLRQCYFPSERYLRYYKVYTQANCEVECLTNFTYARCGCVHFGMPRELNAETWTIFVKDLCKASRRQCYFPSERYLRYYKVYTQANCEVECLTNFTYARCGCVHFGMPHGPDMTVCNAGSVACIKKSQMELVTVAIESRLEEETNENDTLGVAKEVASRCRCLPACTSIEYEAETSQADYDWKALYTAFNITIGEDILDQKFARVMIFFKEAQFITSRRSELYGQTDFLANCGGLLGLFMGFSILSVAEILYFLTLRSLRLRLLVQSAARPCHAMTDGDVEAAQRRNEYTPRRCLDVASSER
ncbi:Sodium channel protein Nach [Papilio machaon]|uniref:Sodium channel protein Nach n=1 Tax=Papilio machaon TaxID=76193 RepID=A0A194R8M9_PAPMA|nr:Sodium channel protein Nach [Papilio machaon]